MELKQRLIAHYIFFKKLLLKISLIDIAKNHAAEQHIQNLQYNHTIVEAFAEDKLSEKFDVITSMKLLELVPDSFSIIKTAAALVKPNGHLFFSTLNRTLKAYLFCWRTGTARYTIEMYSKEGHQDGNCASTSIARVGESPASDERIIVFRY